MDKWATDTFKFITENCIRLVQLIIIDITLGNVATDYIKRIVNIII